MFHLGWFLGDSYGIHPWLGPWSGNVRKDWMKPGMYVDLATSLERGGFDFLFIEDTAMVEDTLHGSMETSLKYGMMAPKNDPLPLMPLMAAHTRHLGIISTISTIQYPPYLAARMMATMDHLTEGRAGMNVVTSVTNRVAQNFGYDEHMEHDERYAQAGEWMDVCTKLWDSWEPDAFVGDTEEPRLIDHTKVHPIHHEGKYFKVRGPLNTMPGPQHRPVIGQAGNSIPGRNLAARHADTMLAFGTSVEQMKTFREDMRARMIEAGRKPDEIKVMFLATPTLGDTDAEARARQEAINTANSEAPIETKLWGLSYISGGTVDFGKFDLDQPVPEIIGNGEQSSLAKFYERARGKTLREALTGKPQVGADLDLVGSPDTVAAKMGEIMEEVGGDGFLLYPEMNRRTIAETVDGLAAALQKRGLVRTGYDAPTFRDNLMAF
ncbi:NtaA/DmoA family FMN-dependent monooxygenase [Nocardioides bruguierae]|uniref:NtaA/DmoA family FMN-dependent monooxygenase n=1 Tax=Nocardioides bruguierae TaxID=2945102 RepID=UPI00202211EA|nr:NtaA/DmoA family FMN-dependent monooxygenase [Nocardioides bruguierae]MCL8025750.1 NtaA/DmoA family FMN-dependent monooxygenase [Nocardioides bruguierae]